MAQTNRARTHRQVQTLQRHFAQQPGLPFADLLPEDDVQQALRDQNISFRERIFSPLVTLWVFLSQLLDPDQSCRNAVARLLAYRVSQGLPPCSANTAAYCKAKQRLPEGLLKSLTHSTGQRLHQQTPKRWLWKGRHVKVADGTTLSMPDTAANQKVYPQARTQKVGLGFPILRLVVVFSLAVGSVLDAAFGPYKGKQTGETALLRQIHDVLEKDDILLADRCYSSYFEIAAVRECHADVVARMHQKRKVDFRLGVRLGRADHVVCWDKPLRPEWMSVEEYAALPERLAVREVRVRVAVRGFRTKVYVVATTLLDSEEATPADLAALYRRRWQAELNLRSLKVSLQMDVLRSKTPGQCHKEIWGHLLVYNLIRGVMAEAASGRGLQPWEISFTGAMQTVNEFAPVLRAARAGRLEEILRELFNAVGQHRVGQRPDRVEPRANKRRPKAHKYMNEPRADARRRLEGRRCA
jgi:hypothetical protein